MYRVIYTQHRRGEVTRRASAQPHTLQGAQRKIDVAVQAAKKRSSAASVVRTGGGRAALFMTDGTVHTITVERWGR